MPPPHAPVDVNDVSEHRKHYPGLKERLRQAAADKAAIGSTSPTIIAAPTPRASGPGAAARAILK